jgi:phosphatidylglycerol:prolipoprotein diacylglycerol transferase
MHRTIVDLGALSIRSYGVMLVVAFWLGIELSARIAKRRGLDPVRILDLGLVVLVSSLIGSRLAYVLTHLPAYAGDPLGVLRIWEGGLTFYGGLAAGIGCGLLYLWRKRLPALAVTDIIAPQLALGVAIARVGCLLNGCCFGRPTTLPWGIVFPPDCEAGWVVGGIPVHPTQIYSSAANLIIFFVLRRLLWRNLASGMVFAAFLVMYGSWRFAIDFLRYYEPSMFIKGLGLTGNQLVSLGMVAIGVVMSARLARHGRQENKA